jgi:thiosulfate dehydrogenase
MINRTTFAAAFLAGCAVIAVVAFALYRPNPVEPTGATAAPATWPDYSSSAGFVTPAVADGELIAYGYKLIVETFALIGPEAPDSTKRLAGNNLACTNCHFGAGTDRAAVPLVGVFGTYPKYSDRSGRVISLAERIDECMARSMNGQRLPDGSREKAAYLAYLRFIGAPQPVTMPPAPPAPLPPDAQRGAVVYERVCAACHQPDGLGKRWGAVADARGYVFPPLWGPDSLDQFKRSVGFIEHNMPRGTDPAHPQLTLQEAWDAAAFLQSQPRPHYAGPR